MVFSISVSCPERGGYWEALEEVFHRSIREQRWALISLRLRPPGNGLVRLRSPPGGEGFLCHCGAGLCKKGKKARNTRLLVGAISNLKPHDLRASLTRQENKFPHARTRHELPAQMSHSYITAEIVTVTEGTAETLGKGIKSTGAESTCNHSEQFIRFAHSNHCNRVDELTCVLD
ncbi:hypothetical protein MHYP_G00116530 [Metynnis hypsauchen]